MKRNVSILLLFISFFTLTLSIIFVVTDKRSIQSRSLTQARLISIIEVPGTGPISDLASSRFKHEIVWAKPRIKDTNNRFAPGAVGYLKLTGKPLPGRTDQTVSLLSVISADQRGRTLGLGSSGDVLIDEGNGFQESTSLNSGKIRVIDSDGASRIALGDLEGYITVVDIDLFRITSRVLSHSGGVTALALMNEMIASGGFNKQVQLWNLETSTTVILQFDYIIDWIKASPDGKFLLVGTPRETVLLDVADSTNPTRVVELPQGYPAVWRQPSDHFFLICGSELYTGGPSSRKLNKVQLHFDKTLLAGGPNAIYFDEELQRMVLGLGTGRILILELEFSSVLEGELREREHRLNGS